MAAAAEGREGDWECSGCRNRNYAFRSLCNRCKQPRILVDNITPADSKWLPRIGDWICSGCSNNNYASREICKKCGQSKEEAAMPAFGMPTYGSYFGRAQGLLNYRMNYGLPLSNPSWSFAGAGAMPWLGYGGSSGRVSELDGRLDVPQGWRDGDWICKCGFHNYSSRAQCKQCNAPSSSAPPPSVKPLSDFYPTLGTKRLASEEFVTDWDNKRLNAGDMGGRFSYERHPYQGSERLVGSSYGQAQGMYSRYATGNTAMGSMVQSSRSVQMPTLLGKGAKQWRDGDWMCNNCNNHNFASRSSCNRCKTEKEDNGQSVCAA